MRRDQVPSPFPAALTVVIDVALVLVFCVIGRLSHAEGIFGDLAGLLSTVWPFLAAVLAAHAILAVRRARTETLRSGLVIWAVTVVVGLALRALSGQGIALPFVIVATLTLALFLLGWRGVLTITRRRREPARS
jgi:hypothetical protein